MWATPNVPNLADYTLFVQNVMGIPVTYLPSNSPFLGYAFNRAMDLVLNVPGGVRGLEYTLAVYNCAAHIQLTITPDQVVGGVAYHYFFDKRAEFLLLQPVTGVVASSSDEGTSVTNAVTDSLKQLSILDLGFMKTYWGRTYLEFAQDYGPSVWGLS